MNCALGRVLFGVSSRSACTFLYLHDTLLESFRRCRKFLFQLLRRRLDRGHNRGHVDSGRVVVVVAAHVSPEFFRQPNRRVSIVKLYTGVLEMGEKVLAIVVGDDRVDFFLG